MTRIVHATALGLASLLLAACAGRDFVRPAPEELVLGRTTYAQIQERFGEPRGASSSLINGKVVKAFNYAFATRLDEPSETYVIPARGMTFFFSDEVLVGHHFLSSFKSDSSDFDDSKVSHIVKGKTTRAEVVRLLGKPVGFYIEPMVKSTAGQAIGYRYTTYKRAPFSAPKRFQKLLTVSFDSADVVSDVVFSRTEDVSAVSTPSAPASPPGTGTRAQETNRNYQFRSEGAKEAHIPQRGWSDCVALPCPGAGPSVQK